MEEHCFIEYKKGGVGRGKTKSGEKKSWKKKEYFELDLLELYKTEMTENEFQTRFAGYNAQDVEWFFSTISKHVIRPKETYCHARNKLLLWLDKMHNCLSGAEMKVKYKIGRSTAVSHVKDVLQGILKTYKNKDVVAFPDENQRVKMVKILKQKGQSMPYVLFSLDGSRTRCTGRKFKERMSHKYK